MIPRVTTKLFGAVVLLALFSPVLLHGQPPPGFSPDRSCTDAGCHRDLTDVRVVHPAMEEGCDTCHEAENGPHAFGDREFDPDLCLACHDEGDDRNWVHADGAAECIDCHEPHGGSRRKLLVEPLTELCQGCHELAVDPTYVSKHAPVSRGECLECHHPHDATADHLLKLPINQTCVRCHRAIVAPRKAEPGVHIKLEDGNGCPLCHDPHESENRRLLKLPFSSDPHTDDLAKSAALCFSCHEQSDLENGNVTGFRTGEGLSLHAEHLEGPGLKRSCAACHQPHLPGKKALVGMGFTMGAWRSPMAYTREDTLATCFPACHEARSYPIPPRTGDPTEPQ